jgi:hypothetical protein
METGDPALFGEWFSHRSDLGTIEVVPVIGSAEAAGRALGTAGTRMGSASRI